MGTRSANQENELMNLHYEAAIVWIYLTSLVVEGRQPVHHPGTSGELDKL